jgi:hypothetical protein
VSAGTSRQRRARALSGQLDEAPARQIVLPRARLLEMLPPPELNGDAEIGGARDRERYAQSLLAQHGVRVFPPLRFAASEEVRLEQTPMYAVQGAITVAGLVTLAGIYKYWAYGLVFAISGGVAVALVAFGYEQVRRWLPAWLPGGRLMGAAVAAALIALGGIVFVLPMRQSRADDHGAGRARALVNAADSEIAAGHLDVAATLLARAQHTYAHAVLIDDVRAHLTEARFQAALDESNRREGVYSQAERAFATGHYARAIGLARSVRGFRDIDQRLRAYRAAQGRHGRGR